MGILQLMMRMTYLPTSLSLSPYLPAHRPFLIPTRAGNDLQLSIYTSQKHEPLIPTPSVVFILNYHTTYPPPVDHRTDFIHYHPLATHPHIYPLNLNHDFPRLILIPKIETRKSPSSHKVLDLVYHPDLHTIQYGTAAHRRSHTHSLFLSFAWALFSFPILFFLLLPFFFFFFFFVSFSFLLLYFFLYSFPLFFW